MEPAKIDWKRIDSVFVEDKLYEDINAPKWVDFLAPPHEDSIDDEAWFCRTDCKHPKTAEDFLRPTPTSKIPSSAEDGKTLPLCERNQRDAKLKRRGLSQSSISSMSTIDLKEDSENQNPNLSTPPNHQVWSMKSMIKSSTERKKLADDTSRTAEAPRPLKSTLSARNLLGGRDIISHITDFCSELKKMATRAREKEEVERLNDKKRTVGEKQEVVQENDGYGGQVLRELDERQKERKPFLEVGKEKSERIEKASIKEKQRRKKRVDDAENIPISINIENVKNKGEDHLLQIRTNPPTPQCFSTSRAPLKSTPSKASRSSRLMERGILQDVEQNKAVAAAKEESVDGNISVSIIDGRGGEARTLDVFWFLKPCTTISS